ncbi:hypothetical protein V492_08351 [Pseudogymnoascus sp. VKM F-4246]|nr:hypothetical protein V492_08351 [Pseudogymnoascus sp. VKM F-4246]KFY30274.1 hypothetical protein V494_08202 [Pseudogymnoascus sp. VKM F-4513 (FW-928)]
MSVKFEKDTVKSAVGSAANEVATSGAATKVANGYLNAYLTQLQKNPLRTKMLTSGSLGGLQELLAAYIAKDRNRHGHYFTKKVPLMAANGAFIMAPVGHVLISILQKIFANRTSLKAKILQILFSNLFIAPIQNSIYLTSMAVINGARNIHAIHSTWKAGFMPVMKVSWVTSPITLAFAQQFLPQETWVPFFNIVGFLIGTYINAKTKKKRLQALKKAHYESGGGRPDDYPRPGMGGQPSMSGGLGGQNPVY